MHAVIVVLIPVELGSFFDWFFVGLGDDDTERNIVTETATAI